MPKHLTPPKDSLQFDRSKDNTDKGQKQLSLIRAAFYQTPATMLMIAHKTGIERASICRYVATLRKAGAIALVWKGFCPITHFRAGFYTTNMAEIEKGGLDECT
ncbi:hypothetical protein EFA69_09575 [Rufibacter immobilis]|uniref:HTH domain-containing protein n=1 Tax=Rufibacter immobilis TaxID=1348778 RepID=A0A3M9MYD8_9BACT|nr:hypothetical protein [Rufibacter immobilis]RNI29778.1 hypothetical protein EFA69_09575 [Rufibacter immobilis]